jgi:predicted transcriptional regulator
MPTRFTVVCDDELAERVGVLAREYDLTEEEVLRQLVDIGLEEVGDRPVV